MGERFPILIEENGSGTEEKREEKVRWGFNVQNISRFDDEAPSSPDGASACQGEVLRQGELFGRPREVADSGNDDGPLCSIMDAPLVEPILAILPYRSSSSVNCWKGKVPSSRGPCSFRISIVHHLLSKCKNGASAFTELGIPTRNALSSFQPGYSIIA